MTWQALIYVTLKGSVLDPQGTAVTKALHAMQYTNVHDVRVGKYLEVVFDADNEQAANEQVQAMCAKFLTNPVIETYTYRLAEVAS